MNIVITGCGKGIGYALLEKFSDYKNSNIIGISRDISKLKNLKTRDDVRIFPVKHDLINLLNDEDSLVSEIFKIFDSIDILINNAGSLVNKDFNKINYEEVFRMFQINTFAPGLLIKKLLPLMGNNKQSHVVNITSMGGFQGSVKFKGLSWYSSSKAALACLTECLAEEYKSSGISFNSIALGAVQTEMLEIAFPGYRAPLSATNIAEFITDFAINGNKYMNGKILPISLQTP